MRSARCADRRRSRRCFTQTVPGLAIAGDGIGGDQQFAHDGGQRDFAGPPILADQPVVEAFEGRGMADRSASGIKQGLAQTGATMTGRFTVAHRAASPGVRRQADKSGDLLGAEQTQLGQIGDQGGGGDGPMPWMVCSSSDNRAVS
jgi:hypothetical protein